VQTVKSADMSELLLEYEAISDIGENLDIPDLFAIPILEALEHVNLDAAAGEEDWSPDDDAEIDELITIYFRQAGRVPLLNAEQERNLAKRIQLGNEAIIELQQRRGSLTSEERLALISLYLDRKKARQRFILANTRFVISVAKAYIDQGLPFADLIQEGNVGLLKAVDRYDHTRGARFTTYAAWWIRQTIMRALTQKSRVVHIPIRVGEKARTYNKAYELAFQQAKRQPTDEEVLENSTLTMEDIEDVKEARRVSDQVSLDLPIGEDSELGDFVEDQFFQPPESIAVHHSLQDNIELLLSSLTEREFKIIVLRFGLDGGEPQTQDQIGAVLGVTGERIGQLEKGAMKVLRELPETQYLKDYLYAA
jgi:RNA polymerase primary sigma factor